MLSAFTNSFKIPELRTRILFTFGLIFVCRILAAVPTPGVNAAVLQAEIARIQATAGGSILGFFNLFSGGALETFAVGSLGIMPYISASIIIQIMTAVVPTLEKLAREGDAGRQKITQYTRYLTILICVVQGYMLALGLENPGGLGIQAELVDHPGLPFRIMTVFSITTASMILMWLGEQMTERGIGNGISLIITISIVSGLPGATQALYQMFRPPVAGGSAEYNLFHGIGLAVFILLVIAGTVAITQAQRKVPVQYAKRVMGRKVYGGQSTYMPLKVNYAGVMPIIFAQAILMFPAMILQNLPWNVGWLRGLIAHMQPGTTVYTTIYSAMILFFSYFWVATQFNPIQIADDLKKYGGYIPGIRPGQPTAQFLDDAMTKITLAGAVFLTVIAVLPMIMAQRFGIPFIVAQFFGGTSLLIIVGVMLDTMRQVESYLLMRNYEGFLRRGKVRGRR